MINLHEVVETDKLAGNRKQPRTSRFMASAEKTELNLINEKIKELTEIKKSQ